jgi:hypothetical protein
VTDSSRQQILGLMKELFDIDSKRRGIKLCEHCGSLMEFGEHSTDLSGIKHRVRDAQERVDDGQKRHTRRGARKASS